MSHDSMPEDVAMRDYDNDSSSKAVDEEDSAHESYYASHSSGAFYDYVPLHRRMTVTPVADHVALADTVLNSPSMASIVIHADADVDMSKRRCHLKSSDHLTTIKSV
jgi:hypothetical protein